MAGPPGTSPGPACANVDAGSGATADGVAAAVWSAGVWSAAVWSAAAEPGDESEQAASPAAATATATAGPAARSRRRDGSGTAAGIRGASSALTYGPHWTRPADFHAQKVPPDHQYVMALR
ncbi:hypothetical protein FAIPA1_20420 [Frankia sp. AiPs1]